MAEGISGGVWGMAVTPMVMIKVEVRVLSIVGMVVMVVQGPVVADDGTVGRMLVVGVEIEGKEVMVVSDVRLDVKVVVEITEVIDEVYEVDERWWCFVELRIAEVRVQ